MESIPYKLSYARGDILATTAGRTESIDGPSVAAGEEQRR
jgi:hypothetical protein